MIEKSLKDISWLVTEEEYRADPAISYSTMAKYEREGFNKLDSLFDRVDTESLTFGSMVDAIITGGQDEFDERFFVADMPQLSEQLIKITKIIFDGLPDGFSGFIDDVTDEPIIAAATVLQYQPNWKPETRAKVIREKCGKYFDMLFLAKNKTIVTTEQYAKVLASVDALKTSEATKWYFQDDNPWENVERLYQLKFKGEYNGIPMRCMMDQCIVLHDEKTIIPIDLKTSYKPEWDFPKSFLEWRYHVQACSYSHILKQNLAKDPYFKDFKVLNYRFIVVNKETLTPLVWEFEGTYSDDDMVVDGVTYRHWKKILPELSHYLNDRPRVPDGINIDKPNSIENYFRHGKDD